MGTWSIRAFCQTLNSIRYVLSLAPKEVKKNLSEFVVTPIAFGMTRAVFSFVIDVTSAHFIVNYKIRRRKNNLDNLFSYILTIFEKYLSESVVTPIAFGMTRAVFSFVIDVTSAHFIVNYKRRWQWKEQTESDT